MVVSLHRWLFSRSGGAGPYKWFLLPALLCVSGAGSGWHPFYVSVTEINENRQENTLEISCKLFTDDLENAINRPYKTHIDILKPRDTAEANKRLAAYIGAHLQLTLNGRARKAAFIGYEQEGGAIWSYLQVNGVSGIKEVAVRNDLLYELFPSQTGIVHVTVNGQRKSIRLNNPDKDARFVF